MHSDSVTSLLLLWCRLVVISLHSPFALTYNWPLLLGQTSTSALSAHPICDWRETLPLLATEPPHCGTGLCKLTGCARRHGGIG
eukprot:m.311926 g.311926  ORF g.311926 m.311926 type:complete len:84 (+) comp16392_c0_seq12:1867-2118(+)